MDTHTDPSSAAATGGSTPIRGAVVEDDAACRHALVGVINAAKDMVLCWAAASRAEALHQLGRADGAGAMDVMLVDLGLPDGSGLEVIAAVRTRHPGAAVMVSTIFGDEQHVLAAIEAGAQDFEPGEEEGTTLFITDPTDLDTVSKALPAQGFKVLSDKLGYKAKTPVSMASLSAEQQEEVQDFLAGIENDDDVQHVYAGLVD